jgi:ribonuclease P protein component
MPSQYGFPPAARVRASAEFGRVFDGGRRHSSPALSLHWLRDAQPARLGLAVSRKVDPDAVGRNRIKRQLRDQFRHLRATLPPGAYVVVARPPAAALANPALRAAFLALLQRAGALPPTDPAGTMTGCPSPFPAQPSE